MVAACARIGRARQERAGRICAASDAWGGAGSLVLGEAGYLAFVEVETDSALAQTVLTQIQGVAGVRDTETHIVVPV